MKELAETARRAASRYFRIPDAGVYDPSGVGGTHVIYVLHDAKNPELYGRLAQKSARSAFRVALEESAEVAGEFGYRRRHFGHGFPLHALRPEEEKNRFRRMIGVTLASTRPPRQSAPSGGPHEHYRDHAAPPRHRRL